MSGNNIYTVLAFVAFLALLFGVGYVVYRNNAVFGDNPLAAPQSAAPVAIVTTATA